MLRNFKILLVDDSQNVLNALKRTFKIEDYRLFFAKSAKEALTVLKENDIDLIISDENMPQVSGTELLKIAKSQYPSVIRMMLTGLTDFEIVKNAINNGEIYKFFNKPWDDFELLLSVRYALHQKTLEEENSRLKNSLKERDEYLSELENNYPGITKKKLSSDGSIILDCK